MPILRIYLGLSTLFCKLIFKKSAPIKFPLFFIRLQNVGRDVFLDLLKSPGKKILKRTSAETHPIYKIATSTVILGTFNHHLFKALAYLKNMRFSSFYLQFLVSNPFAIDLVPHLPLFCESLQNW